jgi:hypothetical protein
MMEPRSRGVLDRQLSRGMTTVGAAPRHIAVVSSALPAALLHRSIASFFAARLLQKTMPTQC